MAVRTRASSVFKGIALLLVLAWVAEVMQLNTLRWMLQLIINTGVIVLVVLFQPELRRALEQIGRSRIRGNSLFVNKQVTEARHEIDVYKRQVYIRCTSAIQGAAFFSTFLLARLP